MIKTRLTFEVSFTVESESARVGEQYRLALRDSLMFYPHRMIREAKLLSIELSDAVEEELDGSQ